LSETKYSVATTGPGIDRFLRQILSDAKLDLTYEILPGESSNPEFENPELMVKFSGPDVDILLGNRAELLLALEQVTMEMLRMPHDDHSRISFDANDYRLLRIEELRLSAGAVAERVKKTGQPFRFSPMNSRERRVVHLALRNEVELRSESSGQGGYRHVVIYPAGMASLPDPPPPPRRPAGPPRGNERDRPGHGDRGRSGHGDRGRPGDRGKRPPFNRDRRP
jgi:spoIIIJ-associated protein